MCFRDDRIRADHHHHRHDDLTEAAAVVRIAVPFPDSTAGAAAPALVNAEEVRQSFFDRSRATSPTPASAIAPVPPSVPSRRTSSSIQAQLHLQLNVDRGRIRHRSAAGRSDGASQPKKRYRAPVAAPRTAHMS
jgi:hypothetical protein